MIATIINSVAVLLGSLIGVLFHSRIKGSMKTVVYTGIGLIALVLGMRMSFETGRIVYLAIALVLGGILGEWWNIEGGILKAGHFLRKLVSPNKEDSDFATGFLDSSVLFCVGAMTLVGSFKAGAEGNYELILTKSVMDGSVAIFLAAALGIGVAFSAVTIMLYQGALTLLAGLLQPVVSDLILQELTGTGGVLVVMIGLNLLGLTKLKTANFLPAILIMLILIIIEGLLPFSLFPA